MKKRVWLILAAAVVLILFLICAISARHSASTLTVTKYELTAPVDEPLRIVQLSDLHNHSFGEGNAELIERIRDLHPDLIFMTGDMISEDDEEIGPLPDLIEALNELAPVYFGYGNHEKQWEINAGRELRPLLERAGATVLDSEYQDLTLNGCALRIGGFSYYYRAPIMTTQDPEQQALQLQFADDYENTERYKILLNHIPTTWLEGKRMNQYPVDLVFCGHYHGGQICFPWGGGLYAPYAGLFPKYTKGMFVGEKAAVILSAGLGSDRWRPRINNPAEIVCVDLLPPS